MNVNDLARGGTAPTSKGKVSFVPVQNVTRPKTRAADNDLQDMNIDLRNNRIRSSNAGNQGGSDFMDGAADFGPDSQRRSSSRGRSGNSSGRKSNNPAGSLSAYTQNMTNIVLNVSKKNQRVTSANTSSPRVVKEPKKNLNQLNDLRTAYGANIPIGSNPPAANKGAASPRSKTAKSAGSADDDEFQQLNSTSADFEQEHINLDTVMPSNNRSLFSPVQDHLSPYGAVSVEDADLKTPQERVSRKPPVVPGSGESSPSVRVPKNTKKSLTLVSPGKSKKSGESLLMESFVKKAKVRDSPSPLSNAVTPDIEILGSSRSDFAASDIAAHDMATLARESATLPSYSLAQQRYEDLRLQDVPSTPLVSNKGSNSVEDDRIENYLDYSDNDADAVGDSYDGTSSRGLSAKIKSMTIEKQVEKAVNVEHVSTRPTEDIDEADKNDFAAPARPQSRKLYLGNERPARPTPTIKAPRSAGARYGAYSPLKGNEADDNGDPVSARPKEGGLKRLGSLDDLKSQIWKEEDHTKERPPSRQSSAFPVHLADHPSTSRGEPRATSSGGLRAVSPSPTITPSGTVINSSSSSGGVSSNSDGHLSAPSSASKIRVKSVKSANTTVASVLNVEDSINNSSAGAVNDSASRGNTLLSVATSVSASTSTTTSYLAPNTELRSVKKSRAIAAANGNSSLGDDTPAPGPVEDEDGSVHSAYQKRPPSRQKVAAQHLFDSDSSTVGDMSPHLPTDTDNFLSGGNSNNRPISSRGGVRSSSNMTVSADHGNRSGMDGDGISSLSSSTTPVTNASSDTTYQLTMRPPSSVMSRSGTSGRSQLASRALTTRGVKQYDPKDDGFGELDLSSQRNVPFVINVNYGHGGSNNSNNNNSSNSLDVVSMGSESNLGNVSNGQASPYRKASANRLCDNVGGAGGGNAGGPNNSVNMRSPLNPVTTNHRSTNNGMGNNVGGGSSTRSTFPSPYSAPFEPPTARPKSTIQSQQVNPSSALATAPQQVQQQSLHQSRLHNSHSAGANGRRKYVSGGGVGLYDNDEDAVETLRSKSAHHSSHHQQQQFQQQQLQYQQQHNLLYLQHNNHQHTPSLLNYVQAGGGGGNNGLSRPTDILSSGGNNGSNSMNNGRGGKPVGAAAFGDWTGPDPRLIPRAQNKFGLEADTGWTSPSFISDELQPPLSSMTRPSLHKSSSGDSAEEQEEEELEETHHDAGDDNEAYRNNMQYYEDDDMTIMTEDSGNEAALRGDHSMSMLSFPLESSLGEDFLSLFAPAGP